MTRLLAFLLLLALVVAGGKCQRRSIHSKVTEHRRSAVDSRERSDSGSHSGEDAVTMPSITEATEHPASIDPLSIEASADSDSTATESTRRQLDIDPNLVPDLINAGRQLLGQLPAIDARTRSTRPSMSRTTTTSPSPTSSNVLEHWRERQSASVTRTRVVDRFNHGRTTPSWRRTHPNEAQQFSAAKSIDTPTATINRQERRTERSRFIYGDEASPDDKQCPQGCTFFKDMSECVCYDRRLAAASLLEAINDFADLTNERQSASEPEHCDAKSDQCNVCKFSILTRLVKADLITAAEMRDVLRRSGVRVPSTATCLRLTSSAVSGAQNFAQPWMSVHTENCLRTIYSRMSPVRNVDTQQRRRQQRVRQAQRAAQRRRTDRRRRQADEDDGLLGERFIVNCVDKGMVASGGNDAHLCTRCWAFRVLPDGYFPRIVNELVCQKDNRECLTGYASCQESLRTVDVRERTSEGRWVQRSTTSSQCCDCRVNGNSGIWHLIDS